MDLHAPIHSLQAGVGGASPLSQPLAPKGLGQRSVTFSRNSPKSHPEMTTVS